jgi:monoamine oxidase
MAMPSTSLVRDVVVVGAGFAGLAVCDALSRLGLSFALLEARDRVGGRSCTHVIDDNTYIDLGAQWIGAGQSRILSLAQRLHISTYPTFTDGNNLLFLNSYQGKFRGTIPLFPQPLALLNMGIGWQRMETMAKEVPLSAPWTATHAKQWDEQTLASWINGAFPSASARALFHIAMETVFACDPSEISLLHALFYIHSAGGLDPLFSSEQGAQQTRVVGGTQALAVAWAREFEEQIHLRCPVQSIEQSEKSVVVRTDSLQVKARWAVVALPPTLALRLKYDPILPAMMDHMLQRLPQGNVIKCFAAYQEPFWRQRGWSGHVLSEQGPIHMTFDACTERDRPGILLAFAEGAQARKLAQLSEEQRQRTVLDCLQRFFGPQARKPLWYVDKSWSDDPWSRGCYSALFPPGVWTQFGEFLRRPFGRILWAGTERSAVWNGYLEGAIRSADDVVAFMKQNDV